MKLWKKSSDSVLLWLSLIWVLAFTLSLFITAPDRLGPFGITAWFGILALSLMFVLSLIRLAIEKALNRKIRYTPRLLYKSALPAVYMTCLLALSSLRQLQIRDIVLLTILILLIEFYRRKK
jgi:hypothetical protein